MRDYHSHGAKAVGIWIRVSTDEQAQGDSPEHHEVRARAYAEAKGWTVREVYDLAGVSGKSVVNHPECKRMMADVKRGQISGLIFSKLARLSRNKRELEDLAEFFRSHEADMISIQDSIDTSTPSGRMFFTFQAAQAHWEREEIAARVAASVPVRAKLGKPLGGLAPFGYRWEGHKLVLDPQDAPIRKLVYELFAQHKRKKTVARILNERGFRTRDGRTRRGGKFSDTTVGRLIADPTAKGERRANYTKSLGDGKAWSMKPETEWVISRVEPIVSETLWTECNALLEARKKGDRPAKKPVRAFTGFVRCHCSYPMYVPSNTPKWVCYKCRNKIPVTDLDELFREELRGYMVDPQKVAEFLKAADGGIAEKRELLASLRKEKGRIRIDSDKCFELYNQGAVTVEQFKARFQPLDARQREIEKELPRLEGEISALSLNQITAEQVTSDGRTFYDRWPGLSEEQKREVIELFLKRIVIGKDDVTLEMVSLPCFQIPADRQRMRKGSLRPRA